MTGQSSNVNEKASNQREGKMDMNALERRLRALQTNPPSARDLQEASTRRYAFWETQPVPQFREDENLTENNYIEAPVDTDRIRKTPYPLPNEEFMWSDVDLNNDDELVELYKLLSENYVEDDESMFRFDYSKEFLKWALMPPGWRKEWHCGLRVTKTRRLLAFIGAIPCKIRIRDKSIVMVEINFLCVHKNLRSKRVTPVLIKEITRRVNLVGIFQAAFTAGVVLPKPITASRYWHRSLNPKKLIECGFSSLTRNMTLQRTIKLYALPKKTTNNLRPLTGTHVQSAFELVSNYLKKFKLHPMFSLEEFYHYFLPQKEVIYTYIILNDDKVTDLISFYSLPSTVVNRNKTHSRIDAAYSFYDVSTSVPFVSLMKDALILAQLEGFDVFNALDLMENSSFLEELKFGIGDGNLQYYLYNWKTPELKPSEVGLVLQ